MRAIAKPILEKGKPAEKLNRPLPVITEGIDIEIENGDSSVEEVTLNVPGYNDSQDDQELVNYMGVVVDESEEDTDVHLPIIYANMVTDRASFWAFIDSLGWKDRPAAYDINIVVGKLQRMTEESRAQFFEHYIVVYNELKTVVENSGALNLLEREMGNIGKKALLSHVIGRGQVIYTNIYNDPYFIVSFVAANNTHDRFRDLHERLWSVHSPLNDILS